MSKDKYPSTFSCQMEAIVFVILQNDNVQGQNPSTFSCQMEAIVFIILQIFFPACTVLKIGVYFLIFPSFSRGYLVM